MRRSRGVAGGSGGAKNGTGNLIIWVPQDSGRMIVQQVGYMLSIPPATSRMVSTENLLIYIHLASGDLQQESVSRLPSSPPNWNDRSWTAPPSMIPAVDSAPVAALRCHSRTRPWPRYRVTGSMMPGRPFVAARCTMSASRSTLESAGARASSVENFTTGLWMRPVVPAQSEGTQDWLRLARDHFTSLPMEPH